MNLGVQKKPVFFPLDKKHRFFGKSRKKKPRNQTKGFECVKLDIILEVAF